ncbi:phosphoglycerate mutase-like protein [Massarina eburnea CBS 473.64]|uniref:Phosphoglycerate mutase-like protein n=1 Tax=Massarina eburnea CBS 473.64 TaxID=1395130 RepID=A0A6A6RXE6_9PLEO|nr:phosphoglycerate mutase-like protein [Massarina eburnea CBS 473.64]
MAFKALSKEETYQHYPEGLKLEGAHIFFRHGARTPTWPLFMVAGLPVYWPLCSGARDMPATVYLDGGNGSQQGVFLWKHVIERVRKDDGPDVSSSDFNLCNHGELTDRGRTSMVQLGHDLRMQYITNLSLLPSVLSHPSTVYFRSSPIPRALESLQHVVWSMFPPESRAPEFGPVTIVQRGERHETLLPNENFCARFIQLYKAYTNRTSERWDNSDEMAYINALIGKHIPHKPIKLAGTPRIHAIDDGITSTLATDKASGVRLPEAFYDKRLGLILDRLAYEEEFGGYSENKELRTVGIGAMLGDVVERMVSQIEHNACSNPNSTSRDDDSKADAGIEAKATKLWLYGSHDTTLGATMASLGADKSIEGERRWPSYGSVVAIELFRDAQSKETTPQPLSRWPSLSLSRQSHRPISRTPTSQLSEAQKSRLQNYYVRLRYNNRSLAIPGCKVAGKNWNGDEAFCTLEAFKDIVDQFTPVNWQKECVESLDRGLPDRVEPAGFIV